ncbi:hypothetical protein SAMN02745166_01570 [Prosthecobacter debontii]|uniref:Uncharacterized protein n=1 Tax=Prosthecobacter debontii TaxID=48467 RepID=A0A1T4XID6_9BACT|nr:hypothetical protein [Prosthecobacter debontii]SKA89329.1 hypothetical protein SAMN02745166_01570 [Prosthecobacter debontii]
MSSRTYPDAKPRLYADEKFKMIKNRLEDAVIGSATEAFGSIAYPGVPPEAFHGFTAFTMRVDEDTADAGNSFHEIGLYQVEAGPSNKPAPNPDPEADNNNWVVLANGDLVRSMLGRPATMETGAWKHELKDQIAVGIANLRLHRDKMNAALLSKLKSSGYDQATAKTLLAAVQPATLDSNWSVLWSFTAFSRGEGQFSKTLLPYVETLAQTPESERWLQWRALVLADVRAKKSNIATVRGKKGAAYALLRSEQKLQSGYELARRLGHDVSWFHSVYSESQKDVDDEDLLTRTGYPPSN